MSDSNDRQWVVREAQALGTFLREQLPDLAYNAVKRLVASGKVFVDGQAEVGPTRTVKPGATVELRMTTPRLQIDRPRVRIVFEDHHVVVVDKPAGVSSVPYEQGERGTAVDLLREAWRKRGQHGSLGPILVVHRIDKETSGLLAFARTKLAERGLQQQLRAHEMDRIYLCVAHGDVTLTRIESLLVPDRGDGLRGSARNALQREAGRRAVTHVKALRRLRGSTECEIRLETGKTHQIRIHLSEQGHPLVGERVYIRDYTASGATPLRSPRLLLHAATLGFEHPVTGARIELRADPPLDYTQIVDKLAGSKPKPEAPAGDRR